jgi:DNA-binding IclR family transcriptional regulator
MTTNRGGIKSVNNLFDIVEKIQELDGAGVTELSEQMDMPKSSVHEYLHTLKQERYVIKEDGVYNLSLKWLKNGTYARRRVDGLEIIRDSMEDLAERTDEVVWFVIEEHGRGVYIEKRTGDKALDPAGGIGTRPYLHSIAAGKAILANLPTSRVEEIINEHGLPKKTDQTITDKERLYSNLDAIKEQNNIAYNDNEEVSGLRAVGTPIFSNGELLGAISIAGPTHRMQEERFREDIPDQLLSAVNEIQLKLMSQ